MRGTRAIPPPQHSLAYLSFYPAAAVEDGSKKKTNSKTKWKKQNNYRTKTPLHRTRRAKRNSTRDGGGKKNTGGDFGAFPTKPRTTFYCRRAVLLLNPPLPARLR